MAAQRNNVLPQAITTRPVLRPPTALDGPAVHRLVASTPPLDANSLYCYLLLCTHFSATTVLAEQKGELVGFTSAFRLPDQPTTLFIWQIAVSSPVRGRGLALTMLSSLLERPCCREITDIEASLQPGNTASWRLFRGLAQRLAASCSESGLFDRDSHFNGAHPDERLIRISSHKGPFADQLQSPPEQTHDDIRPA
jgi:L-2,4-diaminobutyric acid acetyltransferase